MVSRSGRADLVRPVLTGLLILGGLGGVRVFEEAPYLVREFDARFLYRILGLLYAEEPFW